MFGNGGKNRADKGTGNGPEVYTMRNGFGASPAGRNRRALRSAAARLLFAAAAAAILLLLAAAASREPERPGAAERSPDGATEVMAAVPDGVKTPPADRDRSAAAVPVKEAKKCGVPAVGTGAPGEPVSGGPSPDDGTTSGGFALCGLARADDGAAVIDKANSDWRGELLTLDEALSDPDFGGYLLDKPAGFSFESAARVKEGRNSLFVIYTRGMDYLEVRISDMTEADMARLADVGDPSDYDLSLYPIPRAESVPKELREIVENPVFAQEKLTREIVCARAYTVDDAGDSEGYRMRFSVAFGETLVGISAKGLAPDYIFESLSALPR